NTWPLSTLTHGIARRSALSWSRSRVNSFSLARCALRASSHSSRDTIVWFGITHPFANRVVSSGSSAPFPRSRLLHPLRRSGEARIDSRTSRSVVDRLVGRGPEVETDIRRTGGRPGALGHQDPEPCPPWGPNAKRCPGRRPSRTFRGTRPRPRAG